MGKGKKGNRGGRQQGRIPGQSPNFGGPKTNVHDLSSENMQRFDFPPHMPFKLYVDMDGVLTDFDVS